MNFGLAYKMSLSHQAYPGGGQWSLPGLKHHWAGSLLVITRPCPFRSGTFTEIN